MGGKKNNSDTLLYCLTFFSMVLMVACFATHLFTGQTDFIEMDSLAGGSFISVILFLYFCWFVYDSKISKKLSLSQAIGLNLKHNPAMFAMYFYWVVFILVPVLYTLKY